jgi:hypothetical protein
MKRKIKSKNKKIKILFQQLPKVKCCEQLKVGEAFSIPIGFTDIKGTKRIIDLTKPQYQRNVYENYINKKPERISDLIIKEPVQYNIEFIKPEREIQIIQPQEPLIEEQPPPARAKIIKIRRNNREIYADLLRQTNPELSPERILSIVENTPDNELKNKIKDLRKLL